MWDSVGQDIHYGVRSLSRSGGVAIIAVLTLAVGIGTSTAMFSVLDGILLRELPVQDQNALVVVSLQTPAGAAAHWPIAYQDLVAFRSGSHAFESVAGVNFQGASELVMLDAGNPVTLDASWVTGNFFSVLGVAPTYGRTLRPSDDVPGAAPVAVISYAFWQRHFGGLPSAISRALDWNGRSYTVVGILPRGFEYPRQTDAWFAAIPWFPATLDPASTSSPAIQFDLVGRLRRGRSVDNAWEDYQAFVRSTDAERPVDERGSRPLVTPWTTLITGSVNSTLWAATAAVGLLLLIACINVTNLLLIRGSARVRELAIRTALGAGHKRLIRQLLIESGILGVVGGALGILLAVVAVRVLVVSAPADLPRRGAIAIDSPVLCFALAITIVAVLLSGLLPAIVSATEDSHGSIRSAGNATTGSRRTQTLRHSLVVGQVALAFLVAVGAGLLARSLILLQDVNLGFNPDRLLILETTFPQSLVPERAPLLALEQEMVAHVSAIRDVVSATVLPKPPFSGMGGWISRYTAEGQTAQAQAINPSVNLEEVGSGYFQTLAIPIIRGRPLGDEDREDAPRVAVISRAIAQRNWPGESPIGKRITLGTSTSDAQWLTIVGVAGDTRYHELTRLEPSLYVPVRQFEAPVPMTLAVRTRSDAARVIPQIRSALEQVNPALMLAGGGRMKELLAVPLARPRFSTFLLVTFAGITGLIALVGIYGVLATAVSQRTREIGIRLALGAAVKDVYGLILRQGLRLAMLGCALGLLGALAATRLLRSMLFGIAPTDPVTFLAVSGLVLVAAGLAGFLPARRAARVDPLLALRAE